jgi:hypothetical protein
LEVGVTTTDSLTARPFPQLPAEVSAVVASSMFTEFGSLTRSGTPIDTPLFCFLGPDEETIDVATGVAYPAKAERVRANPRVGLLLEGASGQPVVSVAGFGAVRDADLQSNTDRYLAETGAYELYFRHPWEVIREAIWYLPRIIIQTTPVRVLWWSNGDTNEEPLRWEADPGLEPPPSDPGPKGPPPPGPRWSAKDWRQRAEEMLAGSVPAHLTVADAAGFPLPFRVGELAARADGFSLVVAAGAPWRVRGRATLCFSGRATFVGELEERDDGHRFVVERTLPDLPLVSETDLFLLSDEPRRALLGRLEQEVARRGQTVPQIPEQRPASTARSRARWQVMVEESK